MKRTLLTTILVSVCGLLSAQVIFYVEQPPALEGSYAFTYATDWGALPDMLNPNNAVTEQLVFAVDGTSADSLCCAPVVNGAAIAGKIAVLYRGTCNFSEKAYNAQQAGAIAVVIINNVPGSPVGMAGGVNAASVTIPVTMISQSAGAALRDEILAGNVIAFIGNKANLYEHDLGFSKYDVLVPTSGSYPKLLAQNAAEFNFQVEATIRNYGSLAQPDVVLNVQVTNDGNIVYNESSAPLSMASGDSILVSLPPLALSTYDGHYEMSYSVSSGATEEFPGDNAYSTTFTVDSLFSYARIDTNTDLPLVSQHILPSNSVGFSMCAHFRDPNASRMRAKGIWVNSSPTPGGTLDGELIEARAYEWQGNFSGISDAPTTVDFLEVAFGEYFYEAFEADEDVFVPFLQGGFVMEDNKRYLFCIDTYTDQVRLGYQEDVVYDRNQDLYDQPVCLVRADNTWYIRGFTGGGAPTFGVSMVAAEVGMEDSSHGMEGVPFPNPAQDLIRLPVLKATGSAQVEIIDRNGRQVATRSVVLSNTETTTMDISGIPTGQYQFRVAPSNGSATVFKVAISR